MSTKVLSSRIGQVETWPMPRIISGALLIVVLHSVLLLFVLPRFSAKLAPAYNQDRYTDGYEQLAENLAAGRGYRFYPETAETLMREPGYPVFLAGLWWVFGTGFLAVKIANLFLALGTAWLMVLLTRMVAPERVSQSPIVLLPPLLLLFHPAVLIAESRGGIEIIFAFLATLFLLSVVRLLRNQRIGDAVVSGILLGITVYVRSTPILFPFFLGAYLLATERRSGWAWKTCRNITVMLVTMMAVLSPWIVRNYALTGKFIATGDVLGSSAQAGQYINTHLFEGRPWWLLDREASRERDKVAMSLGYAYEDGQNGYYQTFYKTADEVNFSKDLLGRVAKRYKQDPILFVRSLAQNIFNFWCAGKTWGATAANALLQIPLVLLAIVGLMDSQKREGRRVAGLLALFIGYVMAVHLPILAQARYSVPLLPLVSIMASIGVVALRKMQKYTIAAERVAA